MESRDLLAVANLQDVAPGSGSSNAADYVSLGNETFFIANDNSHGLELWKTDGTTAGTVMVKDIAPGAPSAAPEHLTVFQGKLYFTANDQVHGRELWVSDGTEAGTQLVIDIDAVASSAPDYLTVVGNELLFSAYDATNGTELWKFDGTTASLVQDLRSGSFGSTPEYLTNVSGTLFFSANNSDAIGRELWKYDATNGMQLVRNIADLSFESGNPEELFALNGKLYFSAVGPSDNYFGRELYVSDGTSNGTYMVQDINPGVADSSPMYLSNVNSQLWFSANTAAAGRELWKSDGTSPGTEIVYDYTPGSSGSNPVSIVYQTAGAFVHFDTYNYIVYFPDAGPVEYRGNNIYPGQQFVAGNGYLYFSRANSGFNYELWQINTTTRAVTLVQEINPSSGSDPSALTFLNGKLFFTANDGTNGAEPWVVSFNPVVSINGLPGGNTSAEGTAINLSANISSPGAGGPYTYAWSVTKQGAGSPFATGSNSSFSFTPDDNGTYDLSLTVTDSATQQATAQQSLVITNASPIATITGAPISARTGTPIHLTGNVTDPGALDTHTYAWVVMLGSTQVATGHTSALTFTPAQVGTYDVTFTATDDDAGTDSDTVSIGVFEVPTGTRLLGGVLELNGSESRDNIALTLSGSRILVNATYGATHSQQSFALANVQRIVADLGAGNDTLWIDPRIRTRLFVEAGAGNDKITAGSGSSIIVGGNGNDLLYGGSARDLLIGGNGKDQLFGNGGQDLLIAGSTTYDDDAAALASIFAEWTSIRSLATRLQNLRTGAGPVLSGIKLVPQTTVFQDANIDLLMGGAENDWLLWDTAKDRTHDKTPTDRSN